MNQPTVLYHVSDLHFGYEDQAALDWFVGEVERELLEWLGAVIGGGLSPQGTVP